MRHEGVDVQGPLKIQHFAPMFHSKFNNLVDRYKGQDAYVMCLKAHLSVSFKRKFFSWLIYTNEGFTRLAKGDVGWDREGHKGRPPLFIELWGHELGPDGQFVIPNVSSNEEHKTMPSNAVSKMIQDAQSLNYPAEVLAAMGANGVTIATASDLMRLGTKTLLREERFKSQEEMINLTNTFVASLEKRDKAFTELANKVIGMIGSGGQLGQKQITSD